jgi:hypothetical protein
MSNQRIDLFTRFLYPQHNAHVVTLKRAQADYYDRLDEEAMRRGHENAACEFACIAEELRYQANMIESGEDEDARADDAADAVHQ